MKVKVLSIFLLLVLVFSMAGCGGSDNDDMEESYMPREEDDFEEIEGLIGDEEEEEEEEEEDASLNGISDSMYVTVTSNTRVNLRTGPGTKFNVLKAVDPGTELEVVFFLNHWIKVETAEGEEAFIAGWLTDEDLPRPDDANLREEKVEEEI